MNKDYPTKHQPIGELPMKRLLFLFAVASLLVMPQYTLGADVDDLKVTYEKFLQAFNSLDAVTIAKTAEPGLVAYNTSSPFIEVFPTQDSFKQSMQNWFSGLESLNIDPVDLQFKVVGNTGIMWGYLSSTIKPNDGPSYTEHCRITSTFIKSSGQWRVLSIHMSYLP
jgi:ketosteroid isomerase-like protein